MDSSWQEPLSQVAFDAGTARTLGGYELLLPLGAGGMATVWIARRKGTHGFQKIVAVKLMHDRLQASRSHERMFLDEAKLAAAIKHPNVAEIYDLGDQDGVLYQVMEWVDGEPLSALLKACRGKLPMSIAVQIAVQVAAGLHAAHQLRDDDGTPLGLVHRDVSPQNILVGFNGIVKIVDFGVAKAKSNSEHTATGQLKGKISYMSPEQVSGLPVDRRTDIFVLGVVLYLMTTGQHPFRGENDVATIRRLADSKPPVSPDEIDPSYPRALRDVLLQAMSKDPFERYATMAELMRALEAALPQREHITTEDLGAFMRSRLGEARKHRRSALREALRARGESIPPQAASPSLPPGPLPSSVPPPAPLPSNLPPASLPLEQSSAPGRVPSNAAMVVSTVTAEHPTKPLRTPSSLILAGAAGLLGCAIGFAVALSGGLSEGASTSPAAAASAAVTGALAAPPSPAADAGADVSIDAVPSHESQAHTSHSPR